MSSAVVFWPQTIYPLPDIFLIPFTGTVFIYNSSKSESLNVWTNPATIDNVPLLTPAGANHLEDKSFVMYAGNTAIHAGTSIVGSSYKYTLSAYKARLSLFG